MTAEGVTLIGIILIFIGIVAVIIVSDHAYRRDELQTIESTVRRPKSPGPQRQWTPAAYTHTAPARTPSPEQARLIMRAHRECRREECPRKDAACRVLVAHPPQSSRRRTASTAEAVSQRRIRAGAVPTHHTPTIAGQAGRNRPVRARPAPPDRVSPSFLGGTQPPYSSSSLCQ